MSYFFFVLFKNTNILSFVISFQDILCKPAVFSLVKAGHKSSLMYYRRQTDWPTDSLRGGLDAAERHTDQQTEGETDQQPKVVSSLEGDCICHVDMTVFFFLRSLTQYASWEVRWVSLSTNTAIT